MVRPLVLQAVKEAITSAQHAGELPSFMPLPEIHIEHPRQPEHGDYATNIALQLARTARMSPQHIAAAIARHITSADLQAEAVNGFINFRLSPAFLAAQVEHILQQGERWGEINLGNGRKAQVEFGSANPTGYATLGTGRNVVVGDVLANTLAASGYQVHREWYINDAGSQIRAFGESVFARYAQELGLDEPMPEGGYHGDDVAEIGRIIAKREGEHFLHLPREEAIRAIAEIGVALVMDQIKRTMQRLGVHYDNYFSEKSLWASGLGEQMLARLQQKGLILQHDGALWFSEDGSPIRSAQSDAEETPTTDEAGKRLPVQAVVMRSSQVAPLPEERPTYFASDIAYAYHKVILRGFNPAIYVWGEDHQASVERLYAAARALELPEGSIKVVIYRFITLMRGGVEVRMGKRKGNALLIDDVLDEIGADAFRYMMLARSVDTKFTVDIALLQEQNEKNPVYYIQYSHARICSLEARAAAEGWEQDRTASLHYTHPAELALIRKLLELPEVVELVANTLQPHHYPTYARDVACLFSKFYEECRIKGAPPSTVFARLQLARATRLTLAKVLKLMGLSAPEKM
ncbi:MAG: arginine--tRNA ligase [Thermoflexales bacterium]